MFGLPRPQKTSAPRMVHLLPLVQIGQALKGRPQFGVDVASHSNSTASQTQDNAVLLPQENVPVVLMSTGETQKHLVPGLAQGEGFATRMVPQYAHRSPDGCNTSQVRPVMTPNRQAAVCGPDQMLLPSIAYTSEKTTAAGIAVGLPRSSPPGKRTSMQWSVIASQVYIHFQTCTSDACCQSPVICLTQNII